MVIDILCVYVHMQGKYILLLVSWYPHGSYSRLTDSYKEDLLISVIQEVALVRPKRDIRKKVYLNLQNMPERDGRRRSKHLDTSI